MLILIEEIIVFFFIIISVPIILYALQKLTRLKLYNRYVIILVYFILSWFYFDITELQHRINQYEKSNQNSSEQN